jgi:phage/plasmid-associated DNA primase
MRNVVNITNGTMNLDVIEFNPLTEDLMVKAYILK